MNNKIKIKQVDAKIASFYTASDNEIKEMFSGYNKHDKQRFIRGFSQSDFREFILIDYKQPVSEIKDRVKPLKREAGNLSLILRPRYEMIRFNPEFNLWDKFSIKFNQMVLKIKANLVKAKRSVENNPFYQNVVKVFQINSGLTKGYFIKFLVWDWGCLGLSILLMFSSKPVLYLFVFAILVVVTLYIITRSNLIFKPNSKGFIWVKKFEFKFEVIKNWVRDNYWYKQFNYYWKWFIGLRLLYTVLNWWDATTFNLARLYEIYNEVVTKLESFWVSIRKIFLNISLRIRSNRFRFSFRFRSIRFRNCFYGKGRIYASGLGASGLAGGSSSESASFYNPVTQYLNNSLQYHIDNIDPDLERYCVLVNPQFNKFWFKELVAANRTYRLKIFSDNINETKLKICKQLKQDYILLRNIENSRIIDINLLNNYQSLIQKYIRDLSILNLFDNKSPINYTNISLVLQDYDITYPGHIENLKELEQAKLYVHDQRKSIKKWVKDFNCYIINQNTYGIESLDSRIKEFGFENIDTQIQELGIENPNNVSLTCLYKHVKFTEKHRIQNQELYLEYLQSCVKVVVCQMAKLDILKASRYNPDIYANQVEGLLKKILKTASVYHDIIKDVAPLNNENRGYQLPNIEQGESSRSVLSSSQDRGLNQIGSQTNPIEINFPVITEITFNYFKKNNLEFFSLIRLIRKHIDGKYISDKYLDTWNKYDYNQKMSNIIKLYLHNNKLKTSHQDIQELINIINDWNIKFTKYLDSRDNSHGKGKARANPVQNLELEQANKIPRDLSNQTSRSDTAQLGLNQSGSQIASKLTNLPESPGGSWNSGSFSDNMNQSNDFKADLWDNVFKFTKETLEKNPNISNDEYKKQLTQWDQTGDRQDQESVSSQIIQLTKNNWDKQTGKNSEAVSGVQEVDPRSSENFKNMKNFYKNRKQPHSPEMIDKFSYKFT